MEKERNLIELSNKATKSGKAILRKEARIQKTIKNLNTPKKLEKDFVVTPDISAEYSFKKLAKTNTLHFHIFQKQVFANKNKNLQVKKLKFVPTSIFKTKNEVQRIVSSVLITAALFTGTYGTKLFSKHIAPLIEQAYYDYKTNKLPTHKEIGNYDYSENKPSNIIDNKDFQEQEENESGEKVAYPIIKFDSEALNSFSNLVENINETVEIYTGNQTVFSPVFGYITENNSMEKVINIVCKNTENESVLLQYDVYDDVLFYSLFGSNLINTSDAINNLNLLLDSGNLFDMPQISKNFSYDNSIYSHTTPVTKYIEKEIIYDNDNQVGEYKETECFKFEVVKLGSDGKITQTNVKIPTEQAKEMFDVDETNMQNIIQFFAENSTKFNYTETILEEKFNIETSLFLNAINNQTAKIQKDNQTNVEKEF